jgi:tetratricopeptide (TPR) repeat protein
MFSTILMCSALLGADDTPPAADPSAKLDLQTYQSARAKAGKNADAHVRLALWCEAHGLSAERMKHLALAVVYDPSNALARGLLGLVAYQGKWGRPEVVGREIQNDPAYQALIREYLDRRVKTASKVEAQLRLAAWCDQKGLKEQALAHYSEVIRLDPSREIAWRHLGYKKQGHRWVKPEEASAEKQEADRQKLADKQWKLKFEKLREGLVSKDASR